MKIKEKSGFFFRYAKNKTYTSYIPFLGRRLGVLLEHIKGVNEDKGRHRIQETGNQRKKLHRVPGKQLFQIIAAGQRVLEGRFLGDRKDLLEH